MHILEINIKNRVYKYHFDNLVKAKNLETKNVLINEKIYKDLTIYSTRHLRRVSIKMFGLHYYELMEKIEEHDGKKYLIVIDYMLGKVLDKIKETIDI